jgi:hypothetical protein
MSRLTVQRGVAVDEEHPLEVGGQEVLTVSSIVAHWALQPSSMELHALDGLPALVELMSADDVEDEKSIAAVEATANTTEDFERRSLSGRRRRDVTRLWQRSCVARMRIAVGDLEPLWSDSGPLLVRAVAGVDSTAHRRLRLVVPHGRRSEMLGILHVRLGLFSAAKLETRSCPSGSPLMCVLMSSRVTSAARRLMSIAHTEQLWRQRVWFGLGRACVCRS